MRYAALLQQRTGLPIIVSGGSPYAEEPIGEAELALPVLQAWGAHPVLIESNSANTRENARLSLQLLQNRGIHRILLVTHAWHMPRALQAFGKGTLRITAAPTGFYHTAVEALDPGWRRWLSNAGALRQSSRALHEYLGMLWFKIRG